MTILELTSRLAAQPARRLAVLPTPLEDAPRLREALGGRARCPRILVKRDDLTGLGLGGNKARKLDFLIGDALAKGATSVITTGAAGLPSTSVVVSSLVPAIPSGPFPVRMTTCGKPFGPLMKLP